MFDLFASLPVRCCRHLLVGLLDLLLDVVALVLVGRIEEDEIGRELVRERRDAAKVC